jgi:hypothetical protein
VGARVWRAVGGLCSFTCVVRGNYYACFVWVLTLREGYTIWSFENILNAVIGINEIDGVGTACIGN